MKKLLSGMFAVALLQIGFIAYHANDPSAESSFVEVSEDATVPAIASRVSDPFEAPQDIALLEDEWDVEAIDAPVTALTRVIRRPTVTSQPARPMSKRRPLNSYVASANLEQLRPVRVEYKLHSPVAFKAPSGPRILTEFPTAALSAEVPESKSGMARTLDAKKKKRNLFVRVVTKPYDWLKAVGSALR